ADRHVVVCAVDENKELTGDAAKAQKRWIDAGGEICNFSADALDECDVIIDALLGTGLENTVRDNVATIIKAANESTKPILSI
ncbi:NAD(P)H-hydrate epimerase, partial [Pseudoalteromonas sp. GW168-MNA-CIBAN-0100]